MNTNSKQCPKCARLFATSQARASHTKFCGYTKQTDSDGGFGGLSRELEPIMRRMLAIEKRGRKRRFPERVDITTIIDMINVKNCLVQLGETMSALRRQVQESVDASRESVDECQLFSQQSLLFQEEAIKALYMHPRAKRARIED